MVAGWMLYCVAVSALLTGAGFLLEGAAARMDLPRRWAWAVTTLASLLIPLTALLRPERAGGAAEPSAGEAGILVGEIFRIGHPGSLEPGASSLLAGPLLAGLWMTATAALLLIGARSMRRLSRASREWTRATVEGSEVLLSRSTGPAVVGVVRQVIVLPRWVLEAPARERRLVLAHEREHLRARDPLLLACAAAVAVLLPWNLPLWWQLRRLRLAIEMDCDQRVLRAGGELGAYASLLLEVGRRRAGLGRPLLAMAEPVSLLERRIRALTAVRGRRGWAVALAGTVAAASLIAGACSMEGPPDEVNRSQQPPLTGPETTIAAEPRLTPVDVQPSLRNPADVAAQLRSLYPVALREAGVGGQVTLWVRVMESGVPAEVRVRSSSGHAELDEAAVEVIRAARFTPAQRAEAPVEVWIAFPVTFQPDPPPPPVPGPEADAQGMAPPPPPVAAPGSEAMAPPPSSEPRSESYVQPQLLNAENISARLDAAYPADLRLAGVRGTAVLSVSLDAQGRVAELGLHESSGNPRLDEAALTVASEMRFDPATESDRPVATRVVLPVTFAP